MLDTIDQPVVRGTLQQCGDCGLWVGLAQIGSGRPSYRFFGPGVTGMSLSQTSEISHAFIV